MTISIIIPVYNNWHLTKSCLKDLATLPKDHEIIVVDDGSTDRTKSLDHYLQMDEVESEFRERFYHSNIKIVKNEKNMGFARSVNKGFANATKDVILFLNNDIRVVNNKDSWTNVIIDKATEDGLIGTTIGILGSDLHFKMECSKIPTKGNVLVYLSGWCLGANRKTWEKLIEPGCNPFWEKPTTFFEDTDISLRAQEKNIPLHVVSVPLKHIGHATAKKLDITNMYSSAREKFVEKWKDRSKKLLIK